MSLTLTGTGFLDKEMLEVAYGKLAKCLLVEFGLLFSRKRTHIFDFKVWE
jgi:hypothetical protein